MTRHWTRGELAAVIEDAQSTNPGRIADAILAAGVLGDAFDLGVRTWAEYLQAPRTGPMPDAGFLQKDDPWFDDPAHHEHIATQAEEADRDG